MLMQWARETDAGSDQAHSDTSFKTVEDFQEYIVYLRQNSPKLLSESVSLLVDADNTIAPFDHHTIEIQSQLNLDDSENALEMMKALICAAALEKHPSLATWQKVRQVKSNSWQIEHWLANAMIAYASDYEPAQISYISLGKEIFLSLEQASLKSQWERHNKAREEAAAYWESCQNKLEEIWWGLRGTDFMMYEEELPIFNVLYRFAPSVLKTLVSESQSPYLIRSVLMVAGISAFDSRYYDWSQWAASAPVAFKNDGGWNGSAVIPLLLVHARQELLESGRRLPYRDATDAQIENAKQEISLLSKSVVDVLAERSDALPLLARWSTWLMRQLLLHSDKDVSDARSGAYVDNALIEAIGRRTKGDFEIQQPPLDAQTWEHWCYFCLLASHAHSGFESLPSISGFVDEWKISYEDWHGEKGRRLTERASLFTLGKEMPGMHAHLLAYPIVRSTNPTEIWEKMWISAYTLRELVEFGDSDVQKNEFSARSSASELLFLLFSIGLAIFDQASGECYDSKSPKARQMAALHQLLASAIFEMNEIDDTLTRDKWRTAFQHLAIRRLIWEKPECNHLPESISVFSSTDKPAVSDYLLYIRGDVYELLLTVQGIALNSTSSSFLQEILQTASIDLATAFTAVKELTKFSSRRYPVNDNLMRDIDKLMNSVG
ncbi:hypothetical protein CFII64_24144 [Pseudomonas sp. CFII64]|uniref:hypothetical protein n=1 Tax=Pseudomonas sp. CFII64 TaxID=911242 RepID=UPI0003581E3D|nr:hypothetical protein [Pseudomonas sp. CFII64]EPJ77235.1 hypothetical protein CFII64_24144 [Pseudomonas sp. CFII64]